MGSTRERRGAKDSSGLATGMNMNMFWVLANLLLGHTHTRTHTQEESDVIGCMRDPATGNGIDTGYIEPWSTGFPYTYNQLDRIQDSLQCGYVTQVVNGRIVCT